MKVRFLDSNPVLTRPSKGKEKLDFSWTSTDEGTTSTYPLSVELGEDRRSVFPALLLTSYREYEMFIVSDSPQSLRLSTPGMSHCPGLTYDSFDTCPTASIPLNTLSPLRKYPVTTNLKGPRRDRGRKLPTTNIAHRLVLPSEWWGVDPTPPRRSTERVVTDVETAPILR